MNFCDCTVIAVSCAVAPCSYMSALTLIRAKEEDSGNYTMRVENGDQSRSVGLILEVKGQRGECLEPFITFTSLNTALTSFRAQVSVSLFSNIYTHFAALTCFCLDCITVPAVIVDLMDIHHGSATGQSVVCITRGQPSPVVEWFVCKNIKQ